MLRGLKIDSKTVERHVGYTILLYTKFYISQLFFKKKRRNSKSNRQTQKDLSNFVQSLQVKAKYVMCISVLYIPTRLRAAP